MPHWISRFDIWPYLERYALDAERELLAELGGRPDLIIGNYSDGNLVASLMAQRCRSPSATSPTPWRRPSTSTPTCTGATTRPSTTSPASSPPT
jgi:hypothetical protein